MRAGKKRDPKVGTGKKPKGSDRRLYTDENPKDTVAKVMRINKPFARKIQILTVGEQRSRYSKPKKLKQMNIFKKAKEALRRKHNK